MDTSIPETQATSDSGNQATPGSENRERSVRSQEVRRLLTIAAIGFLAVILIAFIFSSAILLRAGDVLVNAQTPRNADMILVIGGDYVGERVLKGAELERDGYAPAVMLSGGGSMYGYHETDLAVMFACDHGYGAEKFLQFRYPATSTVDEAQHVIPRMRELGVHSYILVTSPEHTARAGRVFRRIAPDLALRVVAAPNPNWNGGRWWTSREGRKTWLLESAKTIADWFRL